MEFEKLTRGKNKDPEKLSDLYIEITNDLSFSKSYFPNRSVKVYLNNLSQKIYTSIYKTKRTGKGFLKKFFRDDLPLIMYESRRELLISFLIFLFCAIIGAFSSYKDSSFAEHIMTENYIDQTDENIDNDDPMAIYKSMNPLEMSYKIGFNNLRVAYLTFALGILFGIGTGFILVKNGVLIGVFQFYFIQRGLTEESFLTIWMHGAPEISAIVLAGAAGFTMGRGLLFPKTYVRQESFIVSAKKGISIMLGITPIIIAAAFIEGFITRIDSATVAEFAPSAVPVWNIFRFCIILAMFLAILYYFVIYPYRKFRDVDVSSLLQDFVPNSESYRFRLDVIKNNGNIYADVVRLIGRYFGKILGIGVLSGITFVIGMFACYGWEIDKIIYMEYWIDPSVIAANPEILPAIFLPIFFVPLVVAIFFRHYAYISDLFSFDEFPMLYIVATLLFSVICVYGICFAKKVLQKTDESLLRSFFKNWYKGIFGVAIFMFMYFLPVPAVSFFIMLFLLPLFLLSTVTSIIEDVNPLSALIRSSRFWIKNYGKAIGLYVIMLISSFIFFMFLNSTVQFIIYDMVGWFIDAEDQEYTIILSALLTIFLFIGIVFTAFLLFFGFVFQYYSQKEIFEAKSLLEQIQSMGTKKNKYGAFSKVS
ncbi:MAG: stage II sporulation protein M [Bacteroidota bacterium]